MILPIWRKMGSAAGVASVTPCTPGIFCMDTSTLGGGQYLTVPFDLEGEFRDVQLRWYQAVASQDMEPHYLEFHTTLAGLDDALESTTGTGTFILDSSTLGGARYSTVPVDMAGEFRDLQLRWFNSVGGQDMEPHYLEFAMEVIGVGEEAPSGAF